MHRIIIEMDKEKTETEEEYEFEDMITTLDKMAEVCDLKKEKEGWYIGEIEGANGFVMALLDSKWFIKYVKKWFWWNLTENNIEDVLFTYRRIKGDHRGDYYV